MKPRNHKLSIAVTAVLFAAAVQAQETPPEPATAPAVQAQETPPTPATTPATQAQEATPTPAAPDPSTWKCSKCPFESGYVSHAELGGGYLDDSSAKFGDYTGLDEDGGYVVASASGRASLESGYHLDYELEDLGLDSRSVAIEGGRQGSYEFGLSYDRIPHTISDTGASVYRGIGSDDLTLPDGWVAAGSTAGMTALGTSLHPVEPGFDRDRYGANGRFWFGQGWTFGLDYRRDERSGTRPTYGSFASVSAELLRPIDDATDRIDANVRYQGSRWYAQLGYFASLYDTKTAAYRFDNPFNAAVPGATIGQAALEPDNQYNEVNLSVGWYGLPGDTSVTLSGAMGQGTQDIAFLPYTINPDLAGAALPFPNLDGDVSTVRADLTLSSHPIDRLRLRGAATYDERDNDSRQAAFTSIVLSDLFPVGEERVNPLYGYERTRLYGSADFDVYDDLTVGVGGEYRTTDRTGTRQEVTSEDLLDGYGRVQFRPSGYLGFVIKGGSQQRDPDNYDTDVAADLGQNPLMRKYELAYRYRAYGELLADVAVGDLPLSLGASVYYGDDSYTQSDLGLVSGLDRRYGVDLNWTVNEKITAYVSLTHEKIDSKTKGSSVFGAPDWRSDVQDDFETYGAGVTAQLTDRIKLELDYTYAAGDTHTVIVGSAGGTFPTVKSELSSFKADLAYGFSEQTDFVVTWWYETLDTRDWAHLPEPATMPTVLALGVDPYNYDVNYVTLSLRHRFGGAKATEQEAEAAAEE